MFLDFSYYPFIFSPKLLLMKHDLPEYGIDNRKLTKTLDTVLFQSIREHNLWFILSTKSTNLLRITKIEPQGPLKINLLKLSSIQNIQHHRKRNEKQKWWNWFLDKLTNSVPHQLINWILIKSRCLKNGLLES